MRQPHRIFSPSRIEPDSEMTLDGEQARYISRTLRLDPGDRLRLFDGNGGEFEVVITQVTKSGVRLRTEKHDRAERESPLSIQLLQGVSRGDRMDTVVQKATELGVTRITPVLTDYSVVKLDAARATKRADHWRRVAQSACEQCGRNIVPTIDMAARLSDWLAATDRTAAQKILLQPGAASAIASETLNEQPLSLLVGPEGGLSPGEIEQAETVGFVAVTMGPRTLRTETAAIAAIAILQSRYGDV